MNPNELDRLNEYYPGRSNLLSHLSTLMMVAPPPFMHIFDPHTPRTTSQLIASLLDILTTARNSDLKPIRHALVDAREIITARQFFDRAINAFAGHQPARSNGYENWGGGTWSDSFDSFVAGLREIAKVVTSKSRPADAMDTTETEADDRTCNLILVVENADHLSGSLKELLVPLTRLSEMNTNASTLFISSTRWDDIRDSSNSRSCPDPYLIKVPPLSRDDTLVYLLSHFPPPLIPSPPTSIPPLTPAHEALTPLRSHFLSAVYDICSPHTRDPAELAYVTQATWPAFVEPILRDWKRIQYMRIGNRNWWIGDTIVSKTHMEVDVDSEYGPDCPLPYESTRLRLIRHNSPTILAAFHALHPRKTTARAWAKSHITPNDFCASIWETYPQQGAEEDKKEPVTFGSSHTRMLILASYLASYNPPKSDMRIFGRDASGIPKRKNRGYASKGKGKTATAKASQTDFLMRYAKIPQRLLGPSAFGLERMLAILEALTLEYVDFPGLDEAYEREDTANLETSRARVLSELAQLVQEGQLVRTGAPDSISCSSTFKCNVEFEEVEAIADSLRVPINELLWDPENQ